MGRLRAGIGAATLIGVVVLILVLEVVHGPVVLSLSAAHGVDTGDLVVFPLLVAAVALWRAGALPAGRPGRAVALPAIVLGGLLLLVGLDAKAGGGPLVPAAGGTLDGRIHEAFGTHRLPVRRWSAVAVTYDGARLRLYVDGRQAASEAASGVLQTPGSPLWIGGNRPYGEHFQGRIDDVRVYSRALGPSEISRDMTRPVMPAHGLVAAYGFDAGIAADASGHGNGGAVRGAEPAAGRHGASLHFDGRVAVVRVPPSPSLDLGDAMTLSGWVRPDASQHGWRTIVQRQADAYLLTAGSDRQKSVGRVDDLRAALVVAVLAWLCVAVATADAGGRRRRWWMPVALFVAGSLADAWVAPTGSLMGPALVALWLAATSERRAEAILFGALGASMVGITITALAGAWSADALPSRDDGSTLRTAALGMLFILAGLAGVTAGRRPSSR